MGDNDQDSVADDPHAERAIKDAESGRVIGAVEETLRDAKDVAETVVHGILHPAETFERGLDAHQDPSDRSDSVNTPRNPNSPYPGNG